MLKIEFFATEKCLQKNDEKYLKSVEIVERGPIRATIKLLFKFSDKCIIQQLISMYRNTKRIELTQKIIWKGLILFF